jgi:hypothetical protein
VAACVRVVRSSSILDTSIERIVAVSVSWTLLQVKVEGEVGNR